MNGTRPTRSSWACATGPPFISMASCTASKATWPTHDTGTAEPPCRSENRRAPRRKSRKSLRHWNAPPPSCGGAPPPRLEQAQTARDGDVQALDAPAHRDAYKEVAALAREPAHALAFCAQHPGGPGGQIRLVKRLFGALVRTDDPDVALLQFVERAGEVRHHVVRHGFGRAARHPRHGRADPGGAVLRCDHRVDAGGVRAPQTGPDT